jgi:PAS domain S-box-containing protein
MEWGHILGDIHDHQWFASALGGFLLLTAIGVAMLLSIMRRERRAALATVERERLFHGLVDNSLDLLTLSDHQGRVLVLSPSAGATLGWKPEVLRAPERFDLVHPDDVEALRQALVAAAGEPGTVVAVCYRHRHADGGWRWLEGGVRSFRTRPDAPPVVLTITRDATASKAAEEQVQHLTETLEIRVSERTSELSTRNDQLLQEIIDRTRAESELRRLSAALDQSPSQVLLLGRDRLVEWANRRFLAATHLVRAQAVGVSPFSWCVVPPAEAAERALWATVDGGQEWEGEQFMRSADGATFWAWMTISALRDPDGQVSGYLVGAQDITARKSAEEERARLGGVVEQAAEAIVITTADGTIQYVNPAFEAITGWGRMEAIGLNPRILKSGVHDAAFYAAMWARLRAGGVWSGRLVNRRKDGTIYHQDTTITPVRDGDGQVVRYVAFNRDVTRLVQVEEQLRQAQKLESVGQLAAGIAHEINTPIQFVGDNVTFLMDSFAGMSQAVLAQREALAPGAPPEAATAATEALQAADIDYLMEEMPKALMQAQEGVARVAEIVRAMKEFSHPGAKDLAPADLNRAIENTVTILRNEWKHHAEVVVNLASDLPLVPVLLGEFNQVMLNLLVNAVHAITDRRKKDGSEALGHIQVATRVAGQQVDIRVSDDGCGIPTASKARIFEPFFTTKEVGRGTGQGLALARALIVKKLGGTIEFESEEGVGTTFILRLPIQPAAPGAPA